MEGRTPQEGLRGCRSLHGSPQAFIHGLPRLPRSVDSIAVNVLSKPSSFLSSLLNHVWCLASLHGVNETSIRPRFRTALLNGMSQAYHRSNFAGDDSSCCSSDVDDDDDLPSVPDVIF